jgi:cell division cycle 14
MISIHRSSTGDADGEDEWQLRMRTSRKSSRSPGRSEKRSISTTTTTYYSSIDNDSSNDIENIGVAVGARPKTPAAMKSGSGSNTLAKVRGSPKRSGDSLRGKESTGAGVRKTSGRVGSVSAASASRKVSGL